jgi:hypothetical protein
MIVKLNAKYKIQNYTKMLDEKSEIDWLQKQVT